MKFIKHAYVFVALLLVSACAHYHDHGQADHYTENHGGDHKHHKGHGHNHQHKHGHAHKPVLKSEVVDLGDWGEATKVKQIRHLYFSSQPDVVALEKFKAEGGQVVINLRIEAEKESYAASETAVKALGLDYYHVPVNGKELDKTAFNKITDILHKNKKQKTLIHCSSGNRASAWLVHHIVQDHKQSFSEAIDIAEDTLLTKEGLKKQLEAMYP